MGGQTGCLHSNYFNENSILGRGSLKALEVPKYEHREMYRLTIIGVEGWCFRRYNFLNIGIFR